MSRKITHWLFKCLAFCLLGAILHGMISSALTPLISWSIYHNDPTSPLRRTFAIRSYLPLCALYGFTLGLIPMHRIRELSRSYLGNFTSRPYPGTYNERDWTRPILWAWLPVATLFLLSFILWQPLNRSVLGASISPSRLEYFFSSPVAANMRLKPYVSDRWIFEVIVLTGPTIFLLAYPLGVCFRHQLPSLPETHLAEGPPDSDPPAT